MSSVTQADQLRVGFPSLLHGERFSVRFGGETSEFWGIDNRGSQS